MKIYTKTGDAGETGLCAGPRVRKDHVRIDAYGSVDELNAFLGLVRCERLPHDLDAILERVQNSLFSVGAELATPQPRISDSTRVTDGQIVDMELDIDRFQAELAPLQEFILPSGTKAACLMHVARTVCRRAERRVVTLTHSTSDTVSDRLIRYLNRLSDLLFVMARVANSRAKIPDVPWRQSK